VAYQTQPAETTVAAARQALHEAVVHRRLKYQVAARTVLGSALLHAHQPLEGIAELERGVEDARRLRSPIVTWRAAGALAQALHETGDDERAEAAFVTATEAIGACAEALPDKHRSSFMSAPAVQRVLYLNRS
jgi:predicted Zn-dependent protease